MDKVMSVDEAADKVQMWLDRLILPQDSISVRNGVVGEEPLQSHYEQQKAKTGTNNEMKWTTSSSGLWGDDGCGCQRVPLSTRRAHNSG